MPYVLVRISKNTRYQRLAAANGLDGKSDDEVRAEMGVRGHSVV
jgi:hypothetical protein